MLDILKENLVSLVVAIIILIAIVVIFVISRVRKSKVANIEGEENIEIEKENFENKEIQEEPQDNIDTQYKSQDDIDKQEEPQDDEHIDKQEDNEEKDIIVENEEDSELSENLEETLSECEQNEMVESTRYYGKWSICVTSKREYIAVLTAPNGQVMLTSESYLSNQSAKNGIETIKKNVALNHFEVYSDRNNKHYFKLKDSANKLLCVGQVYKSYARCAKAIESTKKYSSKSIIDDKIYDSQQGLNFSITYYDDISNDCEESGNIVIEDSKTTSETSAEQIDKTIDTTNSTIENSNIEGQINNTIDKKNNYNGKWIINETQQGLYETILVASNGKNLMKSEKLKNIEYAYKTIERFKKSSKESNFIIYTDKNNECYYKLRNSKNMTIAVSEVYDSLKSCKKAIESFKRFSDTAIVEDLSNIQDDDKYGTND